MGTKKRAERSGFAVEDFRGRRIDSAVGIRSL
jgi:hypothetical protein